MSDGVTLDKVSETVRTGNLSLRRIPESLASDMIPLNRVSEAF